MIKLKGTLFYLLLILNITAYSQSYNFRNFSTEDGLAQSYIYSIIQDAQGYLWVGTGNGLSKYNGFVFENYSISDSLADNFITCGISDGGTLWFGHMNGQLSYYNGKKFFHANMGQLNVSHITHFAKSRDNLLWASTYSDGLLKLNKDSGVVKHYSFKDQRIITTFDFLANNELLIGTNTGLLYCRLKGSQEIEIIRAFAEIPGTKIAAIYKMKDNHGFYIASENDGVFQLSENADQYAVSKISVEPGFDITGIQDIYEDNQSDLWLCTFGKGLVKLKYSTPGKIKSTDYYNIDDGFTTSNVKTVFEDREGNIWSGNYGDGLTQITSRTFSIVPIDKHLYGNDIFSMWFNSKFKWIGTENGLVKIDQLTGKILKFYSKGSGLPKDTITAIYSADGEKLWIGTEKNGLFIIEEGTEKIQKYPIATGSLENSINIITGKGSQIWVGTKKGLCSINSTTDSIYWYTINQGGLPHNYINCLFIDRTGTLWITTRSNILAYLKGDKILKMSLNSVSHIFTLGPVTEDSDSRIWVGSNGNGVFKIEADSIINLTVKEGLLSNYCYSIICDDNKNLWVGHKDGLSKIRTTDFLVKPVQHIENITDSYQFNPNAILKDDEKRIWFGSDKGMVVYDPSKEYPKFIPPVLVITSLKINDDERDFSEKIVLSPGNYKIRISFLGISLREPSLVTYQYKLEGYDHWSEITKTPSVTYNNLSEGKYTFVLNSSSGDGAVSVSPLTISFVIKTPVWKNWWFYVIAVSLFIMLIFIYIKRREYRFRAEKKILEEKVTERTFEIQSQKNEIELQRDVINEKNASITASIKYARHIQNAILPPMELIDKLFPENFILSRPKDIVSGDFYWLAEKDGKIVFTVADCTGHGVPGAFMSFLGITLLNSLVNIQGITNSDTIVTNLRERVIHSLQQSRKDITTSDGMDITLCVLDKDNRRVQYSGGMINLVYIRDGKLEVVKADRFSVCVLNEDSGPFSLNEIDLKEGDIFYLFSDGYKDQFGGDFDKKYLVPHFHLTLLEIHKLPMSEQKDLLEKKLNEWIRDGIQTDDITVMGIRL